MSARLLPALFLSALAWLEAEPRCNTSVTQPPDVPLCDGGKLLPALFIMGSLKTGTTSLWSHLVDNTDGHVLSGALTDKGDISRKEKDFFGDPSMYRRGSNYYRRIWPACINGRGDAFKVTVDATPAYHVWHDAPKNMAAFFGPTLTPRLRLVWMLRDPVAKYWSYFWELKSYGGDWDKVSFSEWTAPARAHPECLRASSGQSPLWPPAMLCRQAARRPRPWLYELQMALAGVLQAGADAPRLVCRLDATAVRRRAGRPLACGDDPRRGAHHRRASARGEADQEPELARHGPRPPVGALAQRPPRPLRPVHGALVRPHPTARDGGHSMRRAGHALPRRPRFPCGEGERHPWRWDRVASAVPAGTPADGQGRDWCRRCTPLNEKR